MKMKLIIPILALLVIAGFYGCQSGLQHSEKGVPAEGQNLAYFFNIQNSITASTGSIVGIDGFGTDFDQRDGPPTSPPVKTTTTVTERGALLIAPGGSITIAIPAQFRGEGYLLEFHILYDQNENYDNTEAHFELRDDQGALIAEGEIEDGNEDTHQTFTFQADLTEFAGTSSVTLYNMWAPPEQPAPFDSPDMAPPIEGHTLEINNFAAILPIETKNDANIFIADIRQGSSRINWTNSVWIEDWNTDYTYDSSYVSTPDDFWGDDTNCCTGDINFDLSDVISTMTQPVLEFNYGRSSDDSDASRVYLYDSDSGQIIYIRSDYDSEEDMGHTGIIDLTPWQNSTSFRFNINNRTWLNPFLKIFDAAANSSAVLLDVSPTGREYDSHSGKFLFYQTSNDYLAGGISTDNVAYQAPHWLADPTHPPYGADGILTFSIPGAVSSFNNPVLEIMHFTPDSNTDVADPFGCYGGYAPGCPDYYPIEFYLYADNDEIAHIFFEQMSSDPGGMLKNQIPIREYKDRTSMTIIVPGVANDRWSQMAFPPFIKIFDSIN